MTNLNPMSIQPIEIKNILVPYDFSETAKIALEHAGTLAGKFKATITLLHVKEPFAMSRMEDQEKNNSNQNYSENANKRMEEDTFKFRVLGIKTDYLIEDGKLYKIVEKVSKDKDIDLIVIGTHGVKGRDSFFLGSNAYKVVNHLKVPVLAIQATAKNPYYELIFMPLDETFHTREKIPYAKMIAEKYDSTLSITGLQKHQDQESVKHLKAIINQAEHYVRENLHKVTTRIEGSRNNAEDTLRLAEQEKADLIIIMSEQEKTLSGLFLGPYAQQVVNASKIPVLIIPPRVSLVMSDVSI